MKSDWNFNLTRYAWWVNESFLILKEIRKPSVTLFALWPKPMEIEISWEKFEIYIKKSQVKIDFLSIFYPIFQDRCHNYTDLVNNTIFLQPFISRFRGDSPCVRPWQCSAVLKCNRFLTIILTGVHFPILEVSALPSHRF